MTQKFNVFFFFFWLIFSSSGFILAWHYNIEFHTQSKILAALNYANVKVIITGDENVSETITIPRLENSRLEVLCKKSVLRDFGKFIGKHLCRSLFFNKVAGLSPATLLKKRLWPCNFIQKETLAQVFSCEFCKISMNTFSYRTPPVAASDS